MPHFPHDGREGQWVRHMAAAEAYYFAAFDIVVRAVDAKHDRTVPDGVLVLLADNNGDQLVALVHEDLAEVAEDSLDEEDWRRGTAIAPHPPGVNKEDH